MSISKHSGDNYGGISKLYFALQRDVQDLWDFEYDRKNLSITLANLNSKFNKLNFMMRTAGTDFSKKPTPSGDEYTNVVEANFTKSRADVWAHLGTTTDSQVCLIFQDMNGQWYVLPYADESTAFKTGREPKDTNGYTITWAALLAFPAVPISVI